MVATALSLLPTLPHLPLHPPRSQDLQSHLHKMRTLLQDSWGCSAWILPAPALISPEMARLALAQHGRLIIQFPPAGFASHRRFDGCSAKVAPTVLNVGGCGWNLVHSRGKLVSWMEHHFVLSNSLLGGFGLSAPHRQSP